MWPILICINQQKNVWNVLSAKKKDLSVSLLQIKNYFLVHSKKKKECTTFVLTTTTNNLPKKNLVCRCCLIMAMVMVIIIIIKIVTFDILQSQLSQGAKITKIPNDEELKNFFVCLFILFQIINNLFLFIII